MKICGVIVTYFPTINDVETNIQRFINNIDYLIVWDNTPEHDKSEDFFDRIKSLNPNAISIMGTGRNEGISFALNSALKYASDNNFTHILTMDQDSYWENFAAFKRKIETTEYLSNSIVGPMIQGEMLPSEVNLKEYVITSGTIAPIDKLVSIGGYQSLFRIDGIDIELCVRAKLHGINTYQITDGVLIQQFGSPKAFNILGKKVTTTGYNPIRLNDTARNHILIIRSYGVSKEFKLEFFRHNIIGWSLKILLFESDKGKKLQALWKGVVEGLTSKKIEVND